MILKIIIKVVCSIQCKLRYGHRGSAEPAFVITLTDRIATPAEEDQNTATRDLYKIFRKIGPAVSETSSRTDRQTNWSQYSAPAPQTYVYQSGIIRLKVRRYFTTLRLDLWQLNALAIAFRRSVSALSPVYHSITDSVILWVYRYVVCGLLTD